MAETKDPFVDYQTRPLTDEEKKWLHEWSRDDLIVVNERLYKQKKVHDAGDPVDVRKALDKAGVEPPPEPPSPTYVGAMGSVQQGPLIVEGEDNAGRVPLPRDHPLTVAVDDDDDDDDDDLSQTTDEGKFDTRAVRAEVKTLTVEELKDNLRELEEPVSGNQKELQDRLVKALKKAHEAEQAGNSE